MYNGEKQARGAGGRFGGKKVEAAVASLAHEAVEVGQSAVEAGQQLMQPPAQYLVDAYDGERPGVGDDTHRVSVLATILFAAAVLAVCYGIVTGFDAIF